ncbi:MAG: TonB-dependent receptor [Proteobacteria bacterium]|nr:TonB-dependent receptor [Pseudomonadota bacterium]
MGGVINITTKKGQAKPRLELSSQVASYQTFDTTAVYRGKIDKFGFNLFSTYHDTDGYRDNGFFRKTDVGVKLEYDMFDSITLFLTTATHLDEYGLPGPVGKDNIDSRELRVGTTRPDDGGETSDTRLIGGMEIVFGDRSKVKVFRGYRFRDNKFVMGYSPLIDREKQTISIDEASKNLNFLYIGEYGATESAHLFKCGLDHYYSNYVRASPSWSKRQNSLVEHRGAFVMNQWSLLSDLKINVGYRRNYYQGMFREDQYTTAGTTRIWVNGETFTREWNNTAYDIGSVYSLNSETNLFFSLATSFRTPNIDEFAMSDDDLSPQTGQHLELGMHYRAEYGTQINLTLFQTRVKDEIYFGEIPDSGETVNRNYEDTTRRTGIETEVKVFLLDELYGWINMAYLEAVFEKAKTRVPLTAETEMSAGLEYLLGDRMVFSVTGTLTGDRVDGSDEDNTTYERLPGYQIVDTKFAYDLEGEKQFYIGINNVFDTLYSTITYSESYYPMPTRNFFAGIDWVF